MMIKNDRSLIAIKKLKKKNTYKHNQSILNGLVGY